MDLKEMLEDLKRRRAQIDAAIQAVELAEEALGLWSGRTPKGPRLVPVVNAKQLSPLKRKILKTIERCRPGEGMTATEISKELGSNVGTIWGALRKLREMGLIQVDSFKRYTKV